MKSCNQECGGRKAILAISYEETHRNSLRKTSLGSLFLRPMMTGVRPGGRASWRKSVWRGRGGYRSNGFGFVSLETEPWCVAQASLGFVALLLQCLKSWDCSSVHTYLASACFLASCSSEALLSSLSGVCIVPTSWSFSSLWHEISSHCGYTSFCMIISWFPKCKVSGCFETGTLYIALVGLWLTM